MSSKTEAPEIAAQLAQWAQQVNDASPIKPVEEPPPTRPEKGGLRRKRKRRR